MTLFLIILIQIDLIIFYCIATTVIKGYLFPKNFIKTSISLLILTLNIKTEQHAFKSKKNSILHVLNMYGSTKEQTKQHYHQ